MNKIIVVLFFVICLSNFQAQAQQIVISEVYPAPNADENEWVELYNTSSDSAYLNNWTLSDTLSSPSILHQFVNFVLSPYEVFVLNLSGSKLNNTGDTVVLSDPAATYSATLSYQNSTKGLSWHLNLASNEVYEASPSAGIVAAPIPSPTPTLTPSPTSTPQISPTPEVTLTEIMACPVSGQPEWIKLFNAGATLEISNWLATDSTGNTRRLSGTLTSNDHAIFSWSSSMLNNTGDSIQITTELGTIVDQASYSECTSGASLSLRGDVWQPPQPSPTPEAILVAPQPNTAPTIAESSKSGEVLGNAIEEPPYPYSLLKIINTYTATNSAATSTHFTKETLPPKQKHSPTSGILGSLLVIISSLYAREKPLT